MVDLELPETPVPVWLDCDPGHDDTFAILLAAYHPTIKLLGLSTVFGNAPLEKTTANALSILTAIGKQNAVPVHVGAAKPTSRPPMQAATDIHGESGLDGTDLLPQPSVFAHPVPAVEAMAAALRAQAPGTAWLVATGSLTNVGQLFTAHPDLVSHIKGLSIMGGAVGDGFTDIVMGQVDGVPRVGNWTPWAEFNIIIDPEAAAAVFHNKALAAKTTLVPLDLSHQVLATEEVRELLLYGKDGEKTGRG
ncbi:inosine-uridine preferring nucleoside hydrolase, partial [Colletotrichum musicola]